MSKVTLEYEHLENAQAIFNKIQEYYNDFDWTWWWEWDWQKNGQALQAVLYEYNEENNNELPINLWYVTLFDWWEYEWHVVYWEKRLWRRVTLDDVDINCSFDFSSPIDVMAWIDEYCAEINSMDSFYQIKVA